MGCEQGANTLRLHRRRPGWTPGRSTKMTRGFDKKEAERQQYLQDHSSTKHLKEEIESLKKENEKLKKQLKKYKEKEREEKEYEKLGITIK